LGGLFLYQKDNRKPCSHLPDQLSTDLA